jgi:hypothetical protein
VENITVYCYLNPLLRRFADFAMRTLSRTERRSTAVQDNSHAGIHSFCEVDLPEGIQRGVFSDNQITDFVGLTPSSSLEVLVLDRNPLLSFRGFPPLPALTTLSCLDSPLAALPNFRALAVICAWPHLTRLNRTDVTAADKTSAAAYGAPESARALLVRGWLPRKPINVFPSPKIPPLPTSPSFTTQRKKRPAPRNPPFDREQAKRDAEAESRVLQTVAQQEHDPVSLQMVRILGANGRPGSSDTQIRQSLRAFFGPAKPPASAQSIARSPAEQQIDSRQQVIDTLATEIEVLRTGNRIMNQYEELLRTAGAPLLRNAEELEAIERGARASAKGSGASDYGALRAAVLQYLQADDTLEDGELIAQLNEMLGSEEEDLDVPQAASNDGIRPIGLGSEWGRPESGEEEDTVDPIEPGEGGEAQDVATAPGDSESSDQDGGSADQVAETEAVAGATGNTDGDAGGE